MKLRLMCVIVLAISLLSCSSDEDASKWELPQKIEAKTFEIQTPGGWELIEDQGIDTYIGRIKNDELTIFFDQGHLSFGSLDNIEETNETIYFKQTIINGVPAIIHKEERAGDPSFDTRLSVYLDNGEMQNRLYVLDSDNDDLFIEIFKTHRFLN